MDERITIVRRRLWSMGYSVETVPTVFGCDLLVDGQHKVIVRKHSDGAGEDALMVFALVSKDKAGRSVIMYATAGSEPTVSAREVFGLPANSKVKKYGKKSKGKEAEEGGEEIATAQSEA